MKIRERRPGGGMGGGWESRVREIPDDQPVPKDYVTEPVPDETPEHDWKREE